MTSAFKFLYRLSRAIAVVRHWGARRFTRVGLVVLGALTLTAIMAPDTDNYASYQAFSFLLVLLLFAFCSSFFFRTRFSGSRALPRFGTVGTPLVYTLTLKNLTGKTQKGLAVLENLAGTRPSYQDWLAIQLAYEQRARSFRFSPSKRANPFKLAALKFIPVPDSRAHQEVSVRCELTPLRRGLLRFEGVTLARPDPLGLFRACARLPLSQGVLILPKRYPLPPIALPGTMKYQRGGVALASNVGQSDEFVALRDYRQGDPLRHIHWRTWARAGKPVVKEFEDEFFVRHALVLDTFAEHLHSDAFEEATSVAASFACTIPNQESLLDLLFIGSESYCFTAGRGVAHGQQLLEILASVQPAKDRSFQKLQRLVLNHIGNLSGCIFVFLAWDKARREFIQKIRALGVPMLVLVVLESGATAPLELGPPRDRPERFYLLESGKIEQGLAQIS
jgi:uncharacterized protein (DUF58 family)